MFLLKYVFRLIFFISLCFSQGPFNSYGIGDLQDWNSASAGGSSSLGLVSSYRQNISLSNPTTWPNLKYTFLSLSYSGSESALKNNSKNGYSNLQSAQLIIPIKNKYAIIRGSQKTLFFNGENGQEKECLENLGKSIRTERWTR